MATTVFFERVITDREDKTKMITLEFGRSSAYRDNLIYLSVDGKMVIVDEKTGKEIWEAMDDLAIYLGYRGT